MMLKRTQLAVLLIFLIFILGVYFGMKWVGAESFISGIYGIHNKLGFGLTILRWGIEVLIVLAVPRYLAKKTRAEPVNLKAIQALLLRFVLAYELLFGLNIFSWIVNL